MSSCRMTCRFKSLSYRGDPPALPGDLLTASGPRKEAGRDMEMGHYSRHDGHRRYWVLLNRQETPLRHVGQILRDHFPYVDGYPGAPGRWFASKVRVTIRAHHVLVRQDWYCDV